MRRVPPPPTRFGAPASGVAIQPSARKAGVPPPPTRFAGRPAAAPSAAQAKRPGIPPPTAPRSTRAPGVAQPMLIYGSSGSGGFGGDDDRGGDPPKWRPEDKVGKLVHLPRTKLKGGKHFIPANWSDRMLALAIRLSGNLGRMTNVMSDIQDVTGDEKPMELSSYHYTEKSNDTYVSLTNTKEKGLFRL